VTLAALLLLSHDCLPPHLKQINSASSVNYPWYPHSPAQADHSSLLGLPLSSFHPTKIVLCRKFTCSPHLSHSEWYAFVLELNSAILNSSIFFLVSLQTSVFNLFFSLWPLFLIKCGSRPRSHPQPQPWFCLMLCFCLYFLEFMFFFLFCHKLYVLFLFLFSYSLFVLFSNKNL